MPGATCSFEKDPGEARMKKKEESSSGESVSSQAENQRLRKPTEACGKDRAVIPGGGRRSEFLLSESSTKTLYQTQLKFATRRIQVERSRPTHIISWPTVSHAPLLLLLFACSYFCPVPSPSTQLYTCLIPKERLCVWDPDFEGAVLQVNPCLSL